MGEAIVEFEYIAQEDDELTLKIGDVITNVTKANEGWCEGTLNGRKGMFPDNFVKVIPEIKKEVKSEAPARRPNAGAVSEIRSKLSSVIIPGGTAPPLVAKKPLKRAKVTFAYTPQQEDELALEVGTIIEILKQDEPNWWEGSINGKSGMFPSNFVEIINPSEGDKIGAEEVSEIRGRKVEGVGFGNIFGGGPIVLRAKVEKKDSVDTTKDKVPADPKVLPVKLKPSVPTPTPPASQTKISAKPVTRARVTYPYTAANEDELNLAEGDIVIVLEQNLEDDGWWKGELNGKVGVFPDNFVELLPPESEKPPKPVMPPPPTVGGQKATGAAALMIPDPQKAKTTKPVDPKPSTAPPAVNRPFPPISDSVKQTELKPNLETDDHKAKKNKEITRMGTLDAVKPSEAPLTHPTAARIKPPVRRPPVPTGAVLRDAPVPEEKVAAVGKVQGQVHTKDDHGVHSPGSAPKLLKDGPHDSPTGSYATREQYMELHREVVLLREAMEQSKKSNEKRLQELTTEIDEEKKIRLNLQVEVERLKKMVSSD